MHRWTYLVVAAITAITTTPAQAVDPSIFVGTMGVQFQPMQSAGIREGCTLVYRVVGQDWAYRKGDLISLAGSIVYATNENRTNVGLSLKIGTINAFDNSAKPEPPFFAYIQTPHGTTARSKFVQADGEPGFRLFTFQLDGDTVKVLADISTGKPATIGFNRKKDGLDVLSPLDLSVAETTASDTGLNRRQSNEMFRQFRSCVDELNEQVLKQPEAK